MLNELTGNCLNTCFLAFAGRLRLSPALALVYVNCRCTKTSKAATYSSSSGGLPSRCTSTGADCR